MSPCRSPHGDHPADLAALLATPPSPMLQTPDTPSDQSLPSVSDVDSITTQPFTPSEPFVPRAKDELPIFVPRSLHELLSRETSPDAYATSISARNISTSSNLSDDGFPSFQPFVPPPHADLSEDAIPASFLLNDDFYYQYVGAVKSRPYASVPTVAHVHSSPTQFALRRPVTTGLVPPPPTLARQLIPSPHIDSPARVFQTESFFPKSPKEQYSVPPKPSHPGCGGHPYEGTVPSIQPEFAPIGSGIKSKLVGVSVDTRQVQTGTEYRAFHHTSIRDEVFDPNRRPIPHSPAASDGLAKWLGERTSRREEMTHQQEAASHNRSLSRNTDGSGSSKTSKYSFATAFNQAGYGGHQHLTAAIRQHSRQPDIAPPQLSDLASLAPGNAGRYAAPDPTPWGHFTVPGGTVDLRSIWDRPQTQPAQQPTHSRAPDALSDYGAVGAGRPPTVRPIASGIINSDPPLSIAAATCTSWPTPAQSAQALQYARATQQYAQQQRGAPYASVSIYDQGYPALAESSLTPGDWYCARSDCRFVNFARNVDCKVCGTRRMLDDVRSAQQSQQGPPLGSAGDWQCATCHFINWRRRTLCMKCFPDHASNSDRSFNYPDPRSGSSATLSQAFAQAANLLSPSPDMTSWYDGHSRV